MESNIFKDIIYNELTEVAKALADSKRLGLIDLLCQSEKNVEHLSRELGMSIAATSHHLQIMKKSKLVTDHKVGRFVFYRAAPMGMELWRSLFSIGEQNISEIKFAISSFFTSEEYSAISFKDLRGKVKRGELLLLDVRPREEYMAGHFPGAVSLPLKELEDKINSFPHDKEVVAYCRGPNCVLSQEAVEILRKNKMVAYRLPQGVVEWQSEGNKLEYSQHKIIA